MAEYLVLFNINCEADYINLFSIIEFISLINLRALKFLFIVSNKFFLGFPLSWLTLLILVISHILIN